MLQSKDESWLTRHSKAAYNKWSDTPWDFIGQCALTLAIVAVVASAGWGAFALFTAYPHVMLRIALIVSIILGPIVGFVYYGKHQYSKSSKMR